MGSENDRALFCGNQVHLHQEPPIHGSKAEEALVVATKSLHDDEAVTPEIGRAHV